MYLHMCALTHPLNPKPCKRNEPKMVTRFDWEMFIMHLTIGSLSLCGQCFFHSWDLKWQFLCILWVRWCFFTSNFEIWDLKHLFQLLLVKIALHLSQMRAYYNSFRMEGPCQMRKLIFPIHKLTNGQISSKSFNLYTKRWSVLLMNAQKIKSHFWSKLALWHCHENYDIPNKIVHKINVLGRVTMVQRSNSAKPQNDHVHILTKSTKWP